MSQLNLQEDKLLVFHFMKNEVRFFSLRFISWQQKIPKAKTVLKEWDDVLGGGVCVCLYVCSDNARQPFSPLPVALTDDDVWQKFFTSVVSVLPPVSGTVWWWSSGRRFLACWSWPRCVLQQVGLIYTTTIINIIVKRLYKYINSFSRGKATIIGTKMSLLYVSIRKYTNTNNRSWVHFEVTVEYLFRLKVRNCKFPLDCPLNWSSRVFRGLWFFFSFYNKYSLMFWRHETKTFSTEKKMFSMSFSWRTWLSVAEMTKD